MQTHIDAFAGEGSLAVGKADTLPDEFRIGLGGQFTPGATDETHKAIETPRSGDVGRDVDVSTREGEQPIALDTLCASLDAPAARREHRLDAEFSARDSEAIAGQGRLAKFGAFAECDIEGHRTDQGTAGGYSTARQSGFRVQDELHFDVLESSARRRDLACREADRVDGHRRQSRCTEQQRYDDAAVHLGYHLTESTGNSRR